MKATLVASRVHRGPNRHSPQPAIELRVGWPDGARIDAARWSQLCATLRTHAILAATPSASGSIVAAAPDRQPPSPDEATARLALSLQRAFDRQFDRFCANAQAGAADPVEGDDEAGEPGTIVYPYLDPGPGVLVGQLALVLADSALEDDAAEPNVETLATRALERFAARMRPLLLSGTQSGVTLEARRRGIQVSRVGSTLPVLRVGDGARQKWLWRATTSSTPRIGVVISVHKQLTKELLYSAGLPVPEGMLAETLDAARRVAAQIGFPVVTKPSSTDQGVGITTSIQDGDELAIGFERARAHGSVIVERHIDGADHRLTVIGGRLWRAARRKPAHVIGNGRDDIVELVRKANIERARDAQLREFTLLIDDEAVRLLRRAGMTPQSVPADEAYVRLKTNSNLSTGGVLEAVRVIHPDNSLLAVRAAAVLGLDIAGIDLITTDVTRSWIETGAAICEVNAIPALRRDSDAPAWILEHMYANGERAGIPIVLVVGEPERARQFVDAAERRLHGLGHRVGVACQWRITVGGLRAAHAGMPARDAARIVLADRLVDAAVVACTCLESIEQGFEFERCALAIVLDEAPAAPASQPDARDATMRAIRAAADLVLVAPEVDEIERWAPG